MLSHALVTLSAVLLVVILITALARIALPDQTAWWAGALLSYVLSRIPWRWPA